MLKLIFDQHRMIDEIKDENENEEEQKMNEMKWINDCFRSFSSDWLQLIEVFPSNSVKKIWLSR